LNRTSALLATLAFCLGIPSSCYGMFELLPMFLAGAAILTICPAALLAALVKIPLAKSLSGSEGRIPPSALLLVALAEMVITGLVILGLFISLSPGSPSFGGHASWFFGALFVSVLALSAAFGMAPNLYLLERITGETEVDAKQAARFGHAALLALLTPIFSFGIGFVVFVCGW